MNEPVRELLDRADGHAAAGRGAHAVALYSAAAEAALAGGDLEAATRAVLALARGQRFDATAGLLPARLHEVYSRVEDPAARAGLAAALARTWAYTGQPGRAVPFADTALSLARGLGDPVLLADCLDAVLAAHWGPDDLQRRRDWAAQLDDAAAHLRDPRARLQAHIWGLTVAYEVLDLPRMHRHLRALEILGEESAEARFFAASRRLALDLMLGRLDTAAYLRELAREAAGRAFIADHEAVLHAMTSYPALMRGDRDTCAAEAPVYEEFGYAEGAPAILAEAAWIWAEAGRTDRAATLVGHLGGATLQGLPRDADWLLTVQCVLEAALACGARDTVAAAVELLTPYEGRAVVNAGAVMFHGVTDDTLARGNALLGNAPAADRLRRQALDAYRRIGAVWWRRRLEAAPAGPAPGAAAVRFQPGPGGLWTIGPDGGPAALPPMRGLSYLHHLLARPGTDVAALDLVAAHTGAGTVEQPGTGPAADARALAAYRRRLAELDDRLADAVPSGPAARRLAQERDALRAHLRSVTGLGGRAREDGASAERARVAVRKAIVAALARVAELDPALGRHLYDRVSTGTACRYDPDPEAPVSWLL
ncbi:hypothetical protein [Dactylosporangium sp. CA-092794]|uniref:hypothetical protein n=1 Tax=Dactylosporangium sp. CA-092794 TaxID=3239929 RepID=UPI003D94789D